MLIWIKTNWRIILNALALAWLILNGSLSLGSLEVVSGKVAVLQSQLESVQQQNAVLQTAVDALKNENVLLREKVAFLTTCLTNPLPWPGGSLCPKP